jgi:hypothetical protein
MISLHSLLKGGTALVAVLSATSALAANAPGDAADPQSTSANQAGQANDKQALTSSDILVLGSHTAQAAPISTSLATTQPQSAVSRDFIDNANAAADFNELIALTPSVSITGTGNGLGFGETKAVIRGFQDGEYNITYDSIPLPTPTIPPTIRPPSSRRTPSKPWWSIADRAMPANWGRPPMAATSTCIRAMSATGWARRSRGCWATGTAPSAGSSSRAARSPV